MQKKKTVKKLWVMFYQDKDDVLHWYPLAGKKYYKGERDTERDFGGHTFSLVCIKHYR